MHPGIALIIGLIVGWLIELLFDIFYWRKRRLCPEDEALNLKVELEQTRSDNRSLQVSLDEKQAELDARAGDLDGLNGRIHQLEATLTTRNNELEGIRGDLGDMQAQTDACGSELDGLKTQVGTLQADLSTRDAAIGDLRVELDNKNAELDKLHAELGAIDAEAKELGLGSLFAGGGLALGSFFGNLKGRFSGEAGLETRSADLDLALTTKDAELDSLRLQVDNLEGKLAVCSASLEEMHTNLGADFKGAQGLSMVWGVNTAANNVLATRGIYTYNQLAATNVDDVNDAIELSGEYYPEMDNAAIHGSWVEQSRLAGVGDWDGLFAYQQQNFDVAGMRDDLKKIWGIGPKVEQVMNDNGIYLFSQMAAVPPDRITEILRRAGSRFSMSTGKLHDTWPELARLADKGDWDAFQALQDTLDWSKVQGK
jgi:predicted flap endonuclease-1-like 5' DNA nuclease